MTLPANFVFSQGSLQDYADCPRRFQLRYVLRRAWPAIEAEPALENERHLQLGATFHRLAQQHILGIPPDRLSSTVTDEDLSRWWHNYLASRPTDLPQQHYPEVILSTPLNRYRLIARYDLIAVEPGQRAVIVDWKTSTRRPRPKWLAERLQTRVYPFVLARAGSHLNGGRPIQPEQIEMVYWFANFPEDSERFHYDTAQFEADARHLASLIEEIAALGEDDFPLTAREQRCRYCVYRSLCQRGVRPGALDEAEDETDWGDDFEIALDFEQIAEIEY